MPAMGTFGDRTTKARTMYSLKLPTLHSPRGRSARSGRGGTPRSGRRPTTPRSLVKAGIAPEPGKGPGETLDFNAWVPSDELADVRWQNEKERKWRETQAAQREEALRARVRERRQITSEAQERRERQKRELEEASEAMRKEAEHEFGFKRKLEELAVKEKRDQLDWKRALVEDERRMEEGYRERSKREAAEKESALKAEMGKADDIVNVVLQRQAVRDGKSLVDMQRDASKDEMDEVRRQLEHRRRVKVLEQWEREEEADHRKREVKVKVMEIAHLKEVKKKQTEEEIADLKAEGERVSGVQQHGADEQAAKEADARQWRKEVLLGLTPTQPTPPTAGRPKPGDLRKRFLAMSTKEKQLAGSSRSPRVKAVVCTSEVKRERVQAAHQALAEAKAKLREQQSALKAAESQDEETRQQEESMLLADLEKVRAEAAGTGAARNENRTQRKQAKEAAGSARAQKKAEDIETALKRHENQVASFKNKTLETAWTKELSARRIADAQERERKLQADERARKMRETEAHIAVLQAERKAANDAAYKLWTEQKAVEAAADERREKEDAETRKMAQVSRLMEERQREEKRARQAQAALDRADAVVQAYAEQEARAKEKIAKLLESRKGKKTEAENRKKAVLAEQARKRDEVEATFHEAEEAMRQKRAAAAAQALIDQQDAKKASLRKLEDQREENARAVRSGPSSTILCTSGFLVVSVLAVTACRWSVGSCRRKCGEPRPQ
eukprot:COSAG02_NODE_1187_length_14003_cov_48.566240_11_plen_733_part_00